MPTTFKGRAILFAIIGGVVWLVYDNNTRPPVPKINCGGVMMDKYMCNFVRSSPEEQEKILDEDRAERRNDSIR
jgi:hypothetical protein